MRLILISCGDSKIPFVMSIFDWPITPQKKKKHKQDLKNPILDTLKSPRLGCLYRLQEKNLKQKIWAKNLYFGTCKKHLWLDMQHMATIVLSSWNQTLSHIPQTPPKKTPPHLSPKPPSPIEKKNCFQNIIFKFN